MNNNTPTRREVLKTAATATAVTGFGAVAGSARSERSAQVLEAGLRYETPDDTSLHVLESDSRPPYTVDAQREALFVGPNAGSDGRLPERIAETGALVAEQPISSGQSRGFGPRNEVRSLPIGLTSRKRSRGRLQLSESISPPRLKLNRNGKRAQLVVTGEPTEQILPESDHTVRLEPTTVAAQTTKFVDNPVTDSSIPEHLRAQQQRELGTKQVKVTPVVEVTHHGELTVVDQQIA